MKKVSKFSTRFIRLVRKARKGRTPKWHPPMATYRILRYNLFEQEFEWVALPRNSGFELLLKAGLNPSENLLQVNAFIPPMSELKAQGISKRDARLLIENAKDQLALISEHGMIPAPMSEESINNKVGATFGEKAQLKKRRKLEETLNFGGYGREFVFTVAGASAMRNSAFLMGTPEAKDIIWDNAFAGINPVGKRFAINKALAYAGLLFSASKPMTEIFGRDFDITRVVVVKDRKVKIKVVADVIVPGANGAEDQILRDQVREIEIPIPDGESLYEASLLKHLVNAPTFSFRLSSGAGKGLMVPFNIRAWCKARGVKEIVDIWGNKRPVDEIEVVMFESCFKQASITDSWQDFCQEYAARGGHFRVCVQEHRPNPKWMGYQAMQTLVGADEEDVQYFSLLAELELGKYTAAPFAAQLLGGSAAKAALMYPALFRCRWVHKTAEAAYAARRERCLSSSVPGIGLYLFAVMDPIICMEAACGLELHGSIRAGECVCFACEEGDMDVTRSPHLDHAHVILRNVKSKASRFLVRSKGVVYFSGLDDTTVRLRMDFDGDHVGVCQDERVLDIVRNSYAELGNRVIDWVAPESVKEPFSFWKASQLIAKNTDGNQIGVYANSLTKLWAAYPEVKALYGKEAFREAVAWLTYAGNVLIDAAKHGSVTIVTPACVTLCLMRANREEDDPKTRPLPCFIRHKKANEEHPLGDMAYWKQRVAPTPGVGDSYVKLTSKATNPELVIDELDSMELHYTDFMFDQHRPTSTVPGLTGKDGLFRKLCFLRSEEYSVTGIDRMQVEAWMSDKDIYTRRMIEVAIEASDDPNASWDAAYDIIVRNLFKSGQKPNEDAAWNVVFRTFFSVFGDTMIRALKKNGFEPYDGIDPLELDDDDLEIDDLNDLEW